MSEPDPLDPLNAVDAKGARNARETVNSSKDARITKEAVVAKDTIAANTTKDAVTRNDSVALNDALNNEKDTDKTKHRGDQREKPGTKCGCACKINCDCRCTCACRDHCVCRRPCKGKCGTRVSRNLVVSLDGTSNQFGVQNTNVVELHSRVLADPSAKQSKYYNCGIGTYVPHQTPLQAPKWDFIGLTFFLDLVRKATSWKYLSQKVDNWLDLAFALNFKDIVLRAYRWLSQTYKPGDTIFLFGFSRGAHQVRTLAGMIETVGLVHPGNEEIIPLSSSIFFVVTNDAKEIAENFKKTFSREVRIHFVGVWDTVSSVGVFRGKPPPLTSSAGHICTFRHALALDERRVKFLPEYVDGGSSTATLSTTEAGSPVDVKEVWFAGTHSDMCNLKLNLSSVPLLWMENEATLAGLRLRPRTDGGAWNMMDLEKDHMHESLKGGWWLLEGLPWSHLSFKTAEELTRKPHLGAGRILAPGQRIHISVAFKSKEYCPRATFREDNGITWHSFVGKALKTGNLDWASQLGNQVEMDLFD
ncbi:hypothetical protein B0H17DRAFT_931628, partial [Mycena rosella]